MSLSLASWGWRGTAQDPPPFNPLDLLHKSLTLQPLVSDSSNCLQGMKYVLFILFLVYYVVHAIPVYYLFMSI